MADQNSTSPQRMGLILLALFLCVGIFLAWFFWGTENEPVQMNKKTEQVDETEAEAEEEPADDESTDEEESEPASEPEVKTDTSEGEAAPSAQSPEAPSVDAPQAEQPTVEREDETVVEVIAPVQEELALTSPEVLTNEETLLEEETNTAVTEDPAVTVTLDQEESTPENATEAVETEVALVLPPEIDIVRVDPDGSTVIAGRVYALGRIEIWRDGAPIDGAVLDIEDVGEFAMFATLPFSTEPSSVEIAHFVDGSDEPVMSAQRILIAALPKPEEVEEVAVAQDTITVASTTNAMAEPLGGETVEKTEEAPVVLIEDNGGLRVAQAGGTEAPAAVTFTFTLDTISYAADGSVEIGGRSESDGFIRIYLDNNPITTTQIDESGYWKAKLSDLKTGVYTLRIDELDSSGNVTARVETPFKREEPEVLAAFTHDDDGLPDYNSITIQYGHTLWAIASERYGHGIEYFKVFEANRDRIKDPDLIYPGQVFDIPD